MKLTKEDLNQILDRNIGWIENCDNKSSIAIGSLGVVIGLIFALDYATVFLNILQEKLNHINFGNGCYLLLVGGSLISFIYGGFRLVLSLIPKTDSKIFKDSNLQDNSIIHFNSICQNTNYNTYLEKLNTTKDDDYINDITSQIYICAIICSEKFENYKKGIYYSISGLVAFLTLLSLGYFINWQL